MAAFQDSSTALYAIASTASDARVYLEALEKGTDGIVLHTDDISEIFALKVLATVFFHATNVLHCCKGCTHVAKASLAALELHFWFYSDLASFLSSQMTGLTCNHVIIADVFERPKRSQNGHCAGGGDSH